MARREPSNRKPEPAADDARSMPDPSLPVPDLDAVEDDDMALAGAGSSLGGTEGLTRSGSDTRSLGPSDSSDSGSDFASGSAAGSDELISDSDAAGTGERAGVGRHDADAADLPVDRIVGADEAGLGTGLDEAEEALLGSEVDDEPRLGAELDDDALDDESDDEA